MQRMCYGNCSVEGNSPLVKEVQAVGPILVLRSVTRAAFGSVQQGKQLPSFLKHMARDAPNLFKADR